MNAHRYRLVFNRARGLVMAVAETASAQGKSPGMGAADRPGTTEVASRPALTLARLRPSAFATLLALGAQLMLIPLAAAQIVAYKPAPASQRPTILQAGNGVPLVNIQTPSAAGVSRNTYSQFDVQQQGAILNNSRTNTQTQLGGWVQGNPWLARGSARVILNEVIAANPSRLLGYIEVAGSAAQVVIANPAGVTCNGCGFINASRATLTTGTPVMNNGNLDGYRVEGGHIRIEGTGLDASRASHTDLIARAVEVNAGIWAQALKVTAGANVVDADNSSATPIAGSDPPPAFAIDVAQLGGMYAGKITLVGTEAGVGVRNAGHIGASAGDIQVTIDGKLTNSGNIVADGNLAIGATSLENRNTIDGRDTRLDISGTLDNLSAGRIYGDHLAIAAGTLNNQADSSNAPNISARDRLDLGVTTLNNRDGALIFSAGDMAIGGALDENNRAIGAATLAHNHGAIIEALGNLDLAADVIRNTNAELVTQTITESSRLVQEVQPEGWPARHDVMYFPTIFNYGIEGQRYVVDGVVRGGFEDYTFYNYTATTTATQVVVSKPGKILAGGNASFTGNLENSDSRIIAGGTLTHSGGSLANTATPGVRTTTYNGWAQFRDWDGNDEELDFGPVVGFNPAPTVTTFDLGAAAWSEGTAPASLGATPAAAAGSLYRPAVGTAYHIETDPRFANYRQWLGSDYMLQQLAADPATTQKRLGDGFYEQRLITEQVAQLTGRRFLDGYADDESQYRALMDAGITVAKEWNIRPGIALSAEQVAQLTTDMVWLVEKEVVLPDGRKEKALVPQIYARVQPGDLSPSGSLLSGEVLSIAATGDVANSGTLAGRKLVALTADNVRNLGGTVTGDAVQIAAQQDFAMQGGKIEADNRLDLAAGRNIDIASSTHSTENKEGGDFSRTNIERIAGLYVKSPDGQMRLAAAGDVTLLAAQLESAGTTRIDAGGNLVLGTVTVEEKNHTGGKGYRNESGSRTEIGTRIAANGDIVLTAGQTGEAAREGGQITARAAEVASTDGSLLARANDITIEAGEASAYSDITQQKKRSGFLSSKRTDQRDAFEETTALASTFAADTVALVAGNDVTVKGSAVSATGDLAVAAGRDLIVDTAQNTSRETHFSSVKKSGLSSSMGAISYGKSSLQQSSDGTTVTQVSSTLAGANVTTTSGRDTALIAANLLADDNVTVLAGRNVGLLAAANTQDVETRTKSRSTTHSFSGDVFGKTTIYGKNEARQNTDGQTVSQSTSLVSANAGNVTIRAGLDDQVKATGQVALVAQGADLLAGDTVTLSGNAVDLQAVADTIASHSVSESKSFTIGARAAGVIGSKIAAIGDAVERARNTDNDRLKGALALKAGYDAWKLSQGEAPTETAAGQTAQEEAPSGGSAFGVQVSINTSKNQSESRTRDTQVTGTNVQAKAIDIEATESDLSMAAAKLQAENIALAAQRDILLTAAANTSELHSSNKSSSAGLGVTFGFGQQNGFSIQINAGRAQGKANGSETTWDNTLVTASETLAVRSGKDTTLKGAQLAGESVLFDVGGNLFLETLQDSSRFDSKQSSSGINLSLCIPPICVGSYVQSAAFSSSRQKIKHAYLSAVGQSGIAAGDGGFDISVGNHTDLVGAAITSTAEADKNTLVTASLTSRDLVNAQRTSASSSSVGFSYSAGSSALTNLANSATNNLLTNLTGNAALPKNGSETSETQSVISPAKVTITGSGNEETDNQSRATADELMARDPATANRSLKNTLTLQQAQELQAKIEKAKENQEAANLVGAVLSNMVGDVAAKNGWEKDSPQKLALHGLVGLIEAKIGNGNVAAGVLGAMGQEALTPVLSDYLKENGFDYSKIDLSDPNLTPGERMSRLDEYNRMKADYDSLMQLGTTIAGAAVGTLASGDVKGASTAANASFVGVTNNRLLHEKEKMRIKELANGDQTLEEKLTRAACYEVKCWAEYPEGSADWHKYFVSVGESIALAGELSTIKNEQQTSGLFGYTLTQQAWDDFRAVPLQTIKNGAKVVGGGLAANTGGAITAAGGLPIGIPLMTFGTSEAIEGATGLYNQYQGNGVNGFNPLRTAFNSISPVWGDTIYDGTYLLLSTMSLSATVPAKIGILPNTPGSILVSDGINRTNSLFGVSVPRWQNPILNPITGEIMMTNNTARAAAFYGIGAKIPAISADIDKARSGK